MNDCLKCKRKHTTWCGNCRKNPKLKDNFIESGEYYINKWSLEGKGAKVIYM